MAEEYKFKLQGKREIQGIKISIENKKGSVRKGVDPDGEPWSIKMNYDYGRIPRTIGNDGDNVDVYIGPNLSSDLVFIVHQQDPWKGGWDEDKCFIGFNTKSEVQKAFKSQYDKPGFLGPIDIVSIEVFKDMIKNSKQGVPLGSKKVTDAYLGWDKLVEKLMRENGYSRERAERIAYSIGSKKYGKSGMAKRSAAGRDSEVVLEMGLTPIVKKIMGKLGFKKLHWIGEGWYAPISGTTYSNFLKMVPTLKAIGSPLKKFGYRMRVSPVGFFIEPTGVK